MERGRVQFIKRKLDSTDGFEVSKIVEEIVSDWENMPKEITDKLKENLRKGLIIDKLYTTSEGKGSSIGFLFIMLHRSALILDKLYIP